MALRARALILSFAVGMQLFLAEPAFSWGQINRVRVRANARAIAGAASTFATLSEKKSKDDFSRASRNLLQRLAIKPNPYFSLQVARLLFLHGSETKNENLAGFSVELYQVGERSALNLLKRTKSMATADLLLTLTQAYSDFGDSPKVSSLYERYRDTSTLERSSSYGLALSYIVAAYRAQNDDTSADNITLSSLTNRSLSSHDSALILVSDGLALIANEQFDPVFNEFAEALKRAPKAGVNALSNYWLALSAHVTGKKKEALTFSDRALALLPIKMNNWQRDCYIDIISLRATLGLRTISRERALSKKMLSEADQRLKVRIALLHQIHN